MKALRWGVCGCATLLAVLVSYTLNFCGQSKIKIYHFHKIWCKAVLWIFGIQVEISGLGNIESNKNYVVVSNHSGHGDILALVCGLPLPLCFAAKQPLFELPFFGDCLTHAGHIPVERGRGVHLANALIQNLCGSLDSGSSVVMFPEGECQGNGRIGPFLTGPFRLAATAHREILPIAIAGGEQVRMIGKWWSRKGVIHIDVGVPLESCMRTDSEEVVKSLRDKCRLDIERRYSALYAKTLLNEQATCPCTDEVIS